MLGLTLFGSASAYPVSILNWHEVVNDWVADLPVVITYCPLCGTSMAFLADSREGPLSFGVSGLLSNSDVILFDRETETLWSQLLARAIAGPLRGTRLQALVVTPTTLDNWLQAHPNSLVLSTDTGYARDYLTAPSGDYAENQGLLARVSARSNRYHPKERVLGIEINGSCTS